MSSCRRASVTPPRFRVQLPAEPANTETHSERHLRGKQQASSTFNLTFSTTEEERLHHWRLSLSGRYSDPRYGRFFEFFMSCSKQRRVWLDLEFRSTKCRINFSSRIVSFLIAISNRNKADNISNWLLTFLRNKTRLWFSRATDLFIFIKSCCHHCQKLVPVDQQSNLLSESCRRRCCRTNLNNISSSQTRRPERVMEVLYLQSASLCRDMMVRLSAGLRGTDWYRGITQPLLADVTHTRSVAHIACCLPVMLDRWISLSHLPFLHSLSLPPHMSAFICLSFSLFLSQISENWQQFFAASHVNETIILPEQELFMFNNQPGLFASKTSPKMCVFFR